MNNHEQIKNDNIYRYSDGNEVNSYMKEKYHIERVNVLINLLNDNYSQDVRNKTKVLEVASGNGAISQRMNFLNYDVYCSDLRIEQLQPLSDEGIKIVKLDVSETFPFENETFDAIVAGDIIEHIYDVELFFKECNRILKKGGYLIITTPNLATLQDRVRFLFGVSPKQIQPCHVFYKLHIRPFTLKLLSQTYKMFGFKIVNVKSNFVVWKSFNKYIIYSRSLAKLFPSLGRSLIVCGTKI